MNQSLWIRTGTLAMLLGAWGAAAAGAQTPVPSADAPVDTVGLTLEEAQRRALEANPEFLAERQEYDVAGGQLTQARVYPLNPELELETPGAGTNGSLGEYEATLSQEIEWAGQRGLRIRAARSGLDHAGSVVRNAARRTLAEVSTAFYTALAAQRRLEVVRELFELNEQLLSATRTQAREGEISSMDANLVEIEAGRARAQVFAARREAASTRLELQRLIGVDPGNAIRLVGTLPEAPDPSALDPDSLVTLALDRRPDLAAQSQAVLRMQALTGLARRQAIPNLRVALIADREAQPPGPSGVESRHGSPRIGLGVSVPVPLFDRNQGVVAERAAQTEQARLRRAAAELTVRTQVVDAYQAYLAAAAEARVYETDVLQPARTNQRLLETAYRAGKVGLPTLILLRNQLLDAELGYWEAWLAARRALVALQAATAAPDTDLNLNAPGNR